MTGMDTNQQIAAIEATMQRAIGAAQRLEIERLLHEKWAAIERAEAAEAKVARLEEALRRIAGVEKGMGVHMACCARGQRQALEALAESGGGK